MDCNDTQRRMCLVALAAALCLAAPSSAHRWLDHGQGARPTVPTPAELAGRLERASPPGGYVDLHAPLSDDEARWAGGYRDALGRVVAGR